MRYRGRPWGVSHTRPANGRVEKLYAEELGGTGVVSANLYLLAAAQEGADGEQLRPHFDAFDQAYLPPAPTTPQLRRRPPAARAPA